MTAGHLQSCSQVIFRDMTSGIENKSIHVVLKRKQGIDQKLVLGYRLLVTENVFLKGGL